MFLLLIYLKLEKVGWEEKLILSEGQHSSDLVANQFSLPLYNTEPWDKCSQKEVLRNKVSEIKDKGCYLLKLKSVRSNIKLRELSLCRNNTFWEEKMVLGSELLPSKACFTIFGKLGVYQDVEMLFNPEGLATQKNASSQGEDYFLEKRKTKSDLFIRLWCWLINSNVIRLDKPKCSDLTDSQSYPSYDTKFVQFDKCWGEIGVIVDPSWECTSVKETHRTGHIVTWLHCDYTVGFLGLCSHRLFPFTCQQAPGEMTLLLTALATLRWEPDQRGWQSSDIQCGPLWDGSRECPGGAMRFSCWVTLFHKRGDNFFPGLAHSRYPTA